MARKPTEPPNEKEWTPESIRAGLRKIRRRLGDVEAFDPQKITRQLDPQVTNLETSIRAMLADVFGANTRLYRDYQSAASLDTAGLNMNGTPLHRVIEGFVFGRERSIALLNGAIQFLTEKMEDNFPGEPVDQVALSARTTIMASGRADIRGAAATTLDSLVISATGDVVRPQSEVNFELLMARVAVLEATINAPKPAGIGHNRGPEIEPNAKINEAEIQEFIVLLKQQTATVSVDLPRLKQIAQAVIPPETKIWRGYLDELGKGVAKGAGEEIGKLLIQGAWWTAVYYALGGVIAAFATWVSTLPAAG